MDGSDGQQSVVECPWGITVSTEGLGLHLYVKVHILIIKRVDLPVKKERE